MHTLTKSFVLCGILGVATLSAHAAIVQTVATTATTLNAYAASVRNDDLLQLPGTTAATTGYDAFSSGGNTFGQPATVLRDGSSGGNTTAGSDWPNLLLDSTASGTSGDLTSSVTFTLDLTNAPGGHDISQIVSYSGWSDARAGQRFNLFVSVVGNSTFTQINSGLGGALGNSFGVAFTNGSSRITVTDNSGLIATGVDEIRFDFISAGSQAAAQNAHVYREIDVIAVPEPSVALLGGFGMLGLLRRRRA